MDQIENDENKVIDIKSIKQDYLDIYSAKTGLKKYISAMKFLKNFSIVYIYNTYVEIQRRTKKICCFNESLKNLGETSIDSFNNKSDLQ